MSAQILPFPAPTGNEEHSLTRRTVRRLGGIEHQYRCTCGISCEHPDAAKAEHAFFLYHADLMAVRR